MPIARLTERSHKALQQLALQYGATQQDLLEEAIESLRRKRFFEEAHHAYAVLKADPHAAASLEKERALFDGSLSDGIER